MAFKRALVVDDSRSARLALQKLLEEHDLIVEFAESGEEALDFLKHQLVDVIFMDHTMPGMDGLEAVAAIKRNPRTATIPVMMYTTKEGEVYVGQARALGAVGVLPKQVHPGVLFQMLLDLGLVQERRTEPRDESPAPDTEDAPDDLDRQYEQQALGMSVQTLVTRILEDQHISLRSDILRSHRDFAKQVANEIFHKQAEQQALAAEAPRDGSRGEPSRSGVASGLVTLLTLATLVFAFLFMQIKDERDDLLAEMGRLKNAGDARLEAARLQSSSLIRQQEAVLSETETRLDQSLKALEWAMNQNAAQPFDALPFDDTRAAQLDELLTRLSALGFEGVVTLESHLGEFCLTTDATGSYRLADPEMLIDECALFGHPLDDSSFTSNRQTPGFAAFLSSSPFLQSPGIEVRLVARDRLDSTTQYAYPASVTTAGEWNGIAELNNRVLFRLQPREGQAVLADAETG